MRVGSICKGFLIGLVLLATPAMAQNNSSTVRTEDGRVLYDYRLQLERGARRAEIQAELGQQERSTSGTRWRIDGQRGRLLRNNAVKERIGRNTFTPVANARGRLLQRDRGRALRTPPNRTAAASRRTRSRMMAQRGLLLGPAGGKGRLLRVANRYMDSSYQKRAKFNPATYAAHVPPVTSHVKEDLNYHINAKSGDGYLEVYDKLAGESWKVRLVSHPVIRPNGDGYLAQAGFAGTLGNDTTVYPVVLQFRLEGDEQTWHVKKVDVISANRIVREDRREFVRFVPDQSTETLVTEEVWDDSSYQ